MTGLSRRHLVQKSSTAHNMELNIIYINIHNWNIISVIIKITGQLYRRGFNKNRYWVNNRGGLTINVIYYNLCIFSGRLHYRKANLPQCLHFAFDLHFLVPLEFKADVGSIFSSSVDEIQLSNHKHKCSKRSQWYACFEDTDDAADCSQFTKRNFLPAAPYWWQKQAHPRNYTAEECRRRCCGPLYPEVVGCHAVLLTKTLKLLLSSRWKLSRAKMAVWRRAAIPQRRQPGSAAASALAISGKMA